MFEKIEKDITERMSHYTDSRGPTGDEVAIAWLVTEVERLREIITKTVTNLLDEKEPVVLKGARGMRSAKYLGRAPGSTKVLIDY